MFAANTTSAGAPGDHRPAHHARGWLAAALLLGAVAMGAAGTAALFGDSVSGAIGDMTSRVLDLRIKNNDSAWLDNLPSARPTWTMSGMAPGEYMDYDYAQTRQIDLRNATGGMSGSGLTIGVANIVVDPAGPASDTEEGTTDMDTMMEIVWMEYENGSLFSIVDPDNPSADLIEDVNGNGWIDLDDLEHAPVTGVHAPTGGGRMQMRVRYRPEADSDYQGDSLVSEFRFTEVQ